jgi:hypothetical protein
MAKIDDKHTIFLLKRHVKHDIIKVILGYPPIAIPSELKEWIEVCYNFNEFNSGCNERQRLEGEKGK